MSQRLVFLIKFVRAKTISGPKNPIMAAYGPDPKNPYIFFITGSHGLNYVFFLRVNYGFFESQCFYSKFEHTGFSMGMYGVNTG